MLYQPEAHEALTNEPWSAERVREAIRAIAADAEAAFADGWTGHPLDDDDAKKVPDALDRRSGNGRLSRRLSRRRRNDPLS